MHSDAEYPGNGIGLATAQRVLKRHGGQIWAEAVKDQGATFYFSL
jgi:signal transduction histidine kinase